MTISSQWGPSTHPSGNSPGKYFSTACPLSHGNDTPQPLHSTLLSPCNVLVALMPRRLTHATALACKSNNHSQGSGDARSARSLRG